VTWTVHTCWLPLFGMCEATRARTAHVPTSAVECRRRRTLSRRLARQG
jgi:hypothetical protein